MQYIIMWGFLGCTLDYGTQAESLTSDSDLLKNYLLQCRLFENDEKCFLFYLKSSFCSQDI